jgi:hydroxycarboxylate dehydrogenase B
VKDVTLKAEEWQEIAERVFTAWGTPADIAASVARSLVDNDLAGVSSHGLVRVADYIGHVKAGWMMPEGRPVVRQETAATTLVDGSYGFGQPAAMLALDASMPKARAQGIAAASVVHCGHVGRLGEYAEKAAAAGLVALVAASSGGNGGLVVPFGGMERVFSTNPIAAGVPARDHAPFIMDFATSTVAAGKLELAPDKDSPIPEGWAVNAEGGPAATARQFLEGGGLLPFGGHKGYALSLLVELICSAMTGAGVPLQPVKERKRGFGGNAAFLVVIDIGHFTDADRFLTDVDSLFQRLEGVTPAPGFTQVIIPGAPERDRRASNPGREIRVKGEIWDRIAEVAGEKHVDLGPFAEGRAR